MSEPPAARDEFRTQRQFATIYDSFYRKRPLRPVSCRDNNFQNDPHSRLWAVAPHVEKFSIILTVFPLSNLLLKISMVPLTFEAISTVFEAPQNTYEAPLTAFKTLYFSYPFGPLNCLLGSPSCFSSKPSLKPAPLP